MGNPATQIAGVLKVSPGTMVAAFIGLVLIFAAIMLAKPLGDRIGSSVSNVAMQAKSAVTQSPEVAKTQEAFA